MLRIKHTACPISFRLLTSSNRLCQCTETICIFRTIFICFGKIFQDFCQSSQHPPVSTSPKIFLSIYAFMLRIYIFSIPIVKSGFCIIHDTVSISKILMQLLQVEWILSNVIQFCHYRHHHIQAICPPPIIIIRGTHLIFHHFTGAGNLVCIRL